MTTVITAVEVFSKVDPERACAAIARVGGGKYRVTSLIGDLFTPQDFDDLALAEAHAESFVADLEADPGTIEERVVLKQRITELEKRIAELEAAADVKPVVIGG